MITIRAEQLEKLRPASEDGFVEKLLHLLRQEYPDSLRVDDEEMTRTIRRLLLRAQAYGLRTQRQAGVFVTAAWLMGTDFDTRCPAAREVLPSTVLSAEEKREWMLEWVDATFAALEEA